jgi:hypothetical protein
MVNQMPAACPVFIASSLWAVVIGQLSAAWGARHRAQTEDARGGAAAGSATAGGPHTG